MSFKTPDGLSCHGRAFAGEVDCDVPASAWRRRAAAGEIIGLNIGLTRPSKLRLPERTAAAIMPLSLMVSRFPRQGPELPMHVVQPKPTRLKPSLSSDFAGRRGKIFGDHLASGCQRGLHHGFTPIPLAWRCGKETRADQHIRIRSIRAE